MPKCDDCGNQAINEPHTSSCIILCDECRTGKREKIGKNDVCRRIAESCKYAEKAKAMTGAALADALRETVWSNFDLFGYASSLVEESIDRLRGAGSKEE